MSEIADVANSDKLGENRADSVKCIVEAYMGYAMVRTSENQMRPITAADNLHGAGICGQKYNNKMDESVASGEVGPLILEGYTPAFIETSASKIPAGSNLYCGSGATVNDGYLSSVKPTETLNSADPFAVLIADVEIGDNVGIVKLKR